MTTIVKFADLKALLKLDKATFADYPDLQILADSVHDSLEDEVGRSLSLVAKQTESGFNDLSSFQVDLKNLPIKSISSVEVDGDPVVTGYSIGPWGLLFDTKVLGAWEVTTKGGFKTIPANIYRAELMQIIYEYQNVQNIGVTSFSNDGGTTRSPGFVILKDVKRLLNKYAHVNKQGF